MSNYENGGAPEQSADESLDLLKDVGKQASQKAGQGIKNQVKKQVRKATAKAVKKAVVAMGKMLVKVLGVLFAKLGVVLLFILAFIMLVALCWIIIREFKGAEGQYVGASPALNEFKEGEIEGYEFMQQAGLTGYNRTVFDYYNSLTNNNYWIIDPTDPEQPDLSGYDEDDEDIPLYKMETPQENTEIRDYYSREGDLVTNANLMYSMETYLHKEEFYFTQQFTKPTYYNPKTMKLKPLTKIKANKKEKELVVKSREWDKGEQKFLDDEKIKSVHDWGLGSVFKYKKDKIEKKIVGAYTAEDYYNPATDSVETRTINEPFEQMLEGYPIDIWLLDESVTVAVDTKHQYKEETKVVGGLMDGSTSDSSQPYNKVYAGSYDVYKTVTETIIDPETGEEKEVQREVFDRTVELYKYRTGQLEETKPVPDIEKENELEEQEQAEYEEKHGEPFDMKRYVVDYAEFYTIYRPEDVETELKFTTATNSYGATLPLGEAVNTTKYQKALQYFPIAQRVGAELGIDPYIIIAMISQESGGNPNTSNGGGLMQIHNLLTFTSTVNTTDASGNPISCTASMSTASDPETNIKFGSCYLKSKIDTHVNLYKSIQAYNFDVSGYIKQNYPDAWADDVNNSWMAYIEDARQYYGEKETGVADNYSASYDCIPDRKITGSFMYGDSCYLSHVLQYYGNPNALGGGLPQQTVPTEGDSIVQGDGVAPEMQAPTVIPSNKDEKDGGGLLSSLFEFTWQKFKKDRYGIEVYNYNEDQPHIWYDANTSNTAIEEILTLTSAFNESTPMGAVRLELSDKEFFLNEGNGRATSGSNLGTLATGGDIVGVPSGAEGLIMPINHPSPRSLVTSGYGERWGRLHAGIDFGIPIGTPLYAMGDGVVERAVNHCPKQGSLSGTGTCGSGILEWGNHIKLVLANGDYIIYAHMDELAVTQGTKVSKGTFLGLSGTSGFSSGPHLHLEYRVNGKPINPSFILNTTTIP